MKNIFGKYDIRGVYPEEINELRVTQIVRHFAELVKQRAKKRNPTIVLARDGRTSSPQLYEAACLGLRKSGVGIVEIGMCSTPTMYFGVSFMNADAGIQISASHNPKEFNGLKMVWEKGVPVMYESALAVLEKTYMNELEDNSSMSTQEKVVSIIDQEVHAALSYVQHNLKPLRIVVDASNGAGSPTLQKLFTYLPCEVEWLNTEVDGNFPGHGPDPMTEEGRKQVVHLVKKKKADLGIVVDGDCDRVFFINSKGELIRPAVIGALIMDYYAQQRMKGAIGVDVRPGKIREDRGEALGFEIIQVPAGHSLIKHIGLEKKMLFASESSGHFFSKTPYGFYEQPCILILQILSLMSKNKEEFERKVSEYDVYYWPGEINVNVVNADEMLERVKDYYQQYPQQYDDGVSVHADTWRLNIRRSNTEELVRINIEGENKKVVEKELKKICELIQEDGK